MNERDFNVISTYTVEDAVDDGNLILTDFAVRESLFPLGRVILTPGVFSLTGGESVDADYRPLIAILKRHAAKDWGIICEGDEGANDQALLDGSRLMSAYMIGHTKVWIITEADRSSTTILLPEEY